MVGCHCPTYCDGATNCSCSSSILLVTYDRCGLHLHHSVSFCISFSNYWPEIFSASWKFTISVAVRSSLLDDVFWNWKEGPMCIPWNLDWPLFLFRDARMCNRQCLHSNMIGMLCIASWSPSRAIQTILRCPRPESSVLIPDWTDCRLGFVVDNVDLGGSQFPESILERLYSAHASQQNVVTLEFGSPCSPRSALFAHDLNRHDWQRVAPISHEVFRLQRWVSCFHDKNVFRNHLAHFLCLFRQRVAPICHVPFQRRDSYCHQMNLFGFYSFRQRVAPISLIDSLFVKRIYIDLLGMGRFLPSCTVLVWAPTTGCPDLSRLGFGSGWFDWKFLDCCTTCPSGRWACSEPNSLFQSWRKEIFGGGRGDMKTFSYMTSPSSILTTFGIQ